MLFIGPNRASDLGSVCREERRLIESVKKSLPAGADPRRHVDLEAGVPAEDAAGRKTRLENSHVTCWGLLQICDSVWLMGIFESLHKLPV